ncbi:hypothetical protein [Saccharicrinis aurantiacus]|uniref:hypothetical protein n=1 Tax=Saccharicrinis aurantiacus TaxID=1849719 RepID=UPI00094F8364|nr:hypothetical protein [Saccharicrinis aurantiacus]
MKVLKTALLLCIPLLGTAQVKVDIDVNTKKQYGNISQLQREKFFNMHASSAEFSEDELQYIKDLGVGFGRSFGGPRLGEAEEKMALPREEYLSQLKKNRKNTLKWRKGDTSMEETMISTNHPPGKTGTKGFKWKGVDADYSAEAEYAVFNFKNYYGKDANGYIPLPKYFEPLNEPYVHAKSVATKGSGITQEQVRIEMARMHAQVAKAVRAEVPEVKVGGFASAWPSFELWEFRHWQERMKMFMDVAGDDLDFLSFHIYDGKNVTGGDSFRSGSNAEAIMDIINAYGAIKWGKPKPIVLSEHGITRPDWFGTPYSALRDWKNIRSINHQIMQFMDRPDEIEKVVSFITGKAKWYKNPEGNPYPWVSLRKVNDEYEWTHLMKIYEFWKGVEGNYSSVKTSNPDILSHAFVDGNKAYIAFSNLEGKETLDLNTINLPKVENLKVRRLFLKDDAPALTITEADNNLQSLSIGADEAIILEYTFSKKVKQKKTLQNKIYYASEYLKEIEANQGINFSIAATDKAQSATLKLGISRPLEQALNAKILFNDAEISFPTNWKGYDQKDRTKNGFFGVIDIEIPSELLKNENKLSITFDDGTGFISSVKLNVLE